MLSHECGYYRIERLTVGGRDTGGDALTAVRHVEVPWCAHPKHSPLDQPTALSLGNVALRCDGKVGRCPLSPSKFADSGGR